jgi:hypothetical protein
MRVNLYNVWLKKYIIFTETHSPVPPLTDYASFLSLRDGPWFAWLPCAMPEQAADLSFAGLDAWLKKKSETNVPKSKGENLLFNCADWFDYSVSRKHENVKNTEVLIMDFDNKKAIVSPEQFMKKMAGHRLIVYSSFSSKPERPKFRAIIKLDKPVSDDEYEAISVAMFKNFPKGSFDPTSKNTTQPYYLPNKADTSFYFSVQGKPLSVDVWLKAHREQQNREALRSQMTAMYPPKKTTERKAAGLDDWTRVLDQCDTTSWESGNWQACAVAMLHSLSPGEAKPLWLSYGKPGSTSLRVLAAT